MYVMQKGNVATWEVDFGMLLGVCLHRLSVEWEWALGKTIFTVSYSRAFLFFWIRTFYLVPQKKSFMS